jgi:hypothetical protein
MRREDGKKGRREGVVLEKGRRKKDRNRKEKGVRGCC